MINSKEKVYIERKFTDLVFNLQFIMRFTFFYFVILRNVSILF